MGNNPSGGQKACFINYWFCALFSMQYIYLVEWADRRTGCAAIHEASLLYNSSYRG